ncbi:MAG: transposase [Alicyclobacillus sp.]|nr:transposase [Alicyclobacillus sp.]
MRDRHPHGLYEWLDQVERTDIKELKSFAKSLRRDLRAVAAAFGEPWSSGQVEGQIHRLKLLKRQMYGRAKFDLLRQRVLYRG